MIVSRRLRQTLQFHLSVVFLALVLTVGSVIGWLTYSRMGDVIADASGNLFNVTSTEALAGLERLYAPAELAAEVLARHDITWAETLAERLAHMPVLAGFLDEAPALAGLFVGYDDGDFVMLVPVRDEAARRRYAPPAGTSFVVQAVDRSPGEVAQGRFVFLDSAFRVLGEENRTTYAAYDPRTRPWFERATAENVQIKTDPYIFFTAQTLGQTIALRSAAGTSTVGVDISLSTLAESLSRERITERAELALFDRDLRMIAHPDKTKVVKILPPAATGGGPALGRLSIEEMEGSALSSVAKAAVAAGVTTGTDKTLNDRLRIDGAAWRIQVAPLEIRGSTPYYLAIAVPEAELLAHARLLLQHAALAIAVILLLAVPITMTAARLIAKPVRALSAEAEKIRRFDFADPVEVDSFIIEIDDLARSMNDMKSAIRRFLDINKTISEETDFDRLLDTLLQETGGIAGARRGAIYLVSEDNAVLQPAAAMGGSLALLQAFPLDGLPGILQHACTHNKTYATPVSGASLAICGGDPAAEDNPDRNAVIVPLFNRAGAMIGMMTLVREETGNSALIGFVDALSGAAAIALETRQLIASQKALFQAVTRMIAGAIDAKNPSTGGHCARVPELTKMLAEAAHAASEGPFASLTLTEDDREAIHIAAWLHDCGKVTTPEYVVDKATKLETLYDRIHEIRMRFEVLKRDAWIAFWKGVAGGGDAAKMAEKRQLELAALDADFTFVAECNQGDVFLSPERLERLQDIAARTWTRTLSDRIGIGHEELSRKAQIPEPDLPAAEPLLGDRPDHILPRRPEDRFEPGNPWGFKLAQPEHLYNRGELYNLSVAKGTLTAEERYKINDHIVQTIIMLSRLPFPQHLRQVPELAGGHHEKIDGTGYPRGLTRDEMSPVARIMAIADIFEALTAADRPYKTGKTVSEALKIMGFMVKDGHLDPDLFDLFLTSGVWREYGERFLKPEQIGVVDVDALRPGPRVAA